MKIKTTSYLTIATILIFANFLTRTPLHPEDIVGDPVKIRHLATDSKSIMYSAPYSEAEYELLKSMSMSDRGRFAESRIWKITLRMEILEWIENQGRVGYEKLLQFLPERALYIPEILDIEQRETTIR